MVIIIDSMDDKAGLLRKKILKLLENNNGLTISDVSRILKIHYTTASKYLAVLEAEKKAAHRNIGMAKLFTEVAK
jgi:predicted ArsR family transcriptional regulator